MSKPLLISVLVMTALAACTRTQAPPATMPAQAPRAQTAPAKPAMAGAVTTKNYNGVTIHTYVSPEDGFLDNTQIVETSAGLVIFDGNFFTRYVTEVADYAQGLGKPIERIVLSHAHPDHYSGLTLLHERFPHAPIYAFPEVIAHVEKLGQATLDARNKVFNGAVAKTVTVPTHALAEGPMQISGASFVFEKLRQGEADWQTLVKLPDQHVVMAFDLVAAKNFHLFTTFNFLDSWIGLLESLKPLAEQGYTTILVGHGPATDFSVLDDNIAYLRSAIAAHEASKTPEEYAKRLKKEYPTYVSPTWVEFSSLMLYGVVNP